MYHRHWGLKASPFQGSEPFFHNSPGEEEAQARLEFVVRQSRRMAILTGTSGGGKTQLLKKFASQMQRAGGCAIYLNLTGLGGDELVWQLASQLSAAVTTASPAFAQWRAILDRLTENRYQQIETVLLLDDADEASPDALTQIERLSQLDGSEGAKATLVLAIHDRNLRRLGRQLLDLCDLRIDLEPWELADTKQFIEQGLTRVGGRTTIFDNGAVKRIHDLAHGKPRRVGQLAELALLAGAGRQLAAVDADTVSSASEELGVIPSTAPAMLASEAASVLSTMQVSAGAH